MPTVKLIYEISARILSQKCANGRLGEAPQEWIHQLSRRGFKAVWIMGVWQTGPTSQQISQTHPAFTEHYAADLPDWTGEDVTGSPYSIQRYNVHVDFGGNNSLAILRTRLEELGIKLLLDFVPNHVSPDHAWAELHPEYLIETSETNGSIKFGDRYFACGRDPYFPPWEDTLQLDYRATALRAAMTKTLGHIATMCDGVRCDMAMLVLKDVFENTWGPGWKGDPFWPQAINHIRSQHPDFIFVAEAYWGLESRLLQEGFDYVYAKDTYDGLVRNDFHKVRDHLAQTKLANHSTYFLENHDEPRLAATIDEPHRRYLALITLLSFPGMRLIHDGQVEGFRTRHSVHLGCRLDEAPNHEEVDVYEHLFEVVKNSIVGKGEWLHINPLPTWEEDRDCKNIYAILWFTEDDLDLVVLNTADRVSDARLRLPISSLSHKIWTLIDRLSDKAFERHGDEMTTVGLYVKLEPRECQIFSFRPAD